MTLSTALRKMEISSSVRATDMEIFQHHSPKMDRIRRDFRPRRPIALSFYGYNRPGANVSQGARDAF